MGRTRVGMEPEVRFRRDLRGKKDNFGNGGFDTPLGLELGSEWLQERSLIDDVFFAAHRA